MYQAGTGRDVILIHGFQNDHTAWDPFIERVDLQHTRVTALDLVGCGASSGAAAWTRCTISEYADDLIAVCDALGLNAPVAIGHSLGGAVVLEAALARPAASAAPCWWPRHPPAAWTSCRTKPPSTRSPTPRRISNASSPSPRSALHHPSTSWTRCWR